MDTNPVEPSNLAQIYRITNTTNGMAQWDTTLLLGTHLELHSVIKHKHEFTSGHPKPSSAIDR